MSEKLSNFPSMAAFKDAMTVPILDETLDADIANERFTITQLKALMEATVPITGDEYTPTMSNLFNLGGTTAYLLRYTDVDGIVTVSGRVDFTTPASSSDCSAQMTLPIASAGGLSTVTLTGLGTCSLADASVSVMCNVSGTSANAIFQFRNVAGTTDQECRFTFTYKKA